MASNTAPSPPSAFKPDYREAVRRWEAYYAGEIIDRPVICVTAPRTGVTGAGGSDYRERATGDMEAIVDRALASAEATFWGGEAVPSFYPSFGPDEIAVFCGAGLGWSPDSGDTNWSMPCVERWEDSLPLRLRDEHPLWQRMLTFYRLAAERMAGKMALSPLDLHTNMDLLAALRGPQRLCLDVIERPEIVDRAMEDARAIFRQVWDAIRVAGRMDTLGYCQGFYSMAGAATLQCDYSCMIGPDMFRRWVLPALEEEAEIVRHAVYHWDGPEAVIHTNDLVRSRGLHTLSYVPGDGRGRHIDYLDLYRRVQAGGKAVQVWGSPDELKAMHRELRPEKTLYCSWAGSQSDAETLLDWFVRNT